MFPPMNFSPYGNLGGMGGPMMPVGNPPMHIMPPGYGQQMPMQPPYSAPMHFVPPGLGQGGYPMPVHPQPVGPEPFQPGFGQGGHMPPMFGSNPPMQQPYLGRLASLGGPSAPGSNFRRPVPLGMPQY